MKREECQPEATAADEVADLRRCFRNLASLSLLASLWVNQPLTRALQNLADLLRAALREEIVYICAAPHSGPPTEVACSASSKPQQAVTEAVRKAFAGLRTDLWSAPALPHPLGRGSIFANLVPIAWDGREVGKVVCGSREPLSANDRLLLTVAAAQVTLVLQRQQTEAERAASLERAREAQSEATLLYEVSSSLVGELDLEPLLQRVTDAGTKVVGAQFGAFFYNSVNEHGEAYVLYTLSGAPRQAFEKFGVPRNTPLFSPTFHGQGVIRLDDVLKDSRYGRNPPHHGMPTGHLPVRSYLAVPVKSRSGEVFGGLFFGHPDVGVFTERAERICVGIAAQAAIAIDNAQLFGQVQRELAQRKKAEADREHLLEREQAARRQAEEANGLKDEFLATVSHELRTPLTAISGWSHLLQLEQLDPVQRSRAVAAIQRSSDTLLRLVNDLLDVSSITSGRYHLDLRPLSLRPLVEETVDVVRPSARIKQIVIETLLEEGDGTILGDPDRLRQIIWNLLSNGIKFTPPAGTISVELTRSGSYFQILVKDTGPGIPDDFLPYVFDPFRQAEPSLTRSQGGLGLGMAIVRHLVEMHGGTVSVQNRHDRTGSVFAVRFPVSPREADEPSPANPRVTALQRQAPAGLKDVSVLLLDDDGNSREIVSLYLSSHGFRVRAAASAPEARALFEECRPHIILADLAMPGEDGLTFMRNIRGKPTDEGGQIPAVAITACTRTEDRVSALRAGFQSYLPKPIDPEELLAVIASLVQEREGPREPLSRASSLASEG